MCRLALFWKKGLILGILILNFSLCHRLNFALFRYVAKVDLKLLSGFTLTCKRYFIFVCPEDFICQCLNFNFSHGHFTLFWVKSPVKTSKILGSARDLICINPARLILYRFNFFIQLLEYSKPNPSSPPPPSSSSFYP